MQYIQVYFHIHVRIHKYITIYNNIISMTHFFQNFKIITINTDPSICVYIIITIYVIVIS
jgi:hypothetical protein